MSEQVNVRVTVPERLERIEDLVLQLHQGLGVETDYDPEVETESGLSGILGLFAIVLLIFGVGVVVGWGLPLDEPPLSTILAKLAEIIR